LVVLKLTTKPHEAKTKLHERKAAESLRATLNPKTMYFKQFYLGCLAHASYLIGSEGEALVVDPQRDVDQYIDEADAQGFKIKYVIETHLHADFVSGHRELASRTGAEIVFGSQADAAFPHRSVREGDEIRIGKVVLRIIETPGHSSSTRRFQINHRKSSPATRSLSAT
jgi:hydroxyacylglutathione hydrolase